MVVLIALVGTAAVRGDTEKILFAIEISGTVCGYTEVEIGPAEKDGRDVILLKQATFAKVSALGADIDTEVTLVYHIDPETYQFIYHESEVKQGQMDLWSKVHVDGDAVRFTSNLSGEKLIELPPGVLRENSLVYPHIVQDLHESGLDEKTYDLFDVREAQVQQTTYTKAGVEVLPLAGENYNALIIDAHTPATGLKYRVWIDTETGYLLQADLPNDRRTYRSSESIKKRIRTVSLDQTIMSRVDVSIADFQSIVYMQVRAKIEPTGLRVSVEGLSVPGQRFTGTVVDNLIDGVFEIEHPRYDGLDAPPFPSDFSADASLKEYLEAEEFIECEDPVLIEKAAELTEGAPDSWEAAGRLSEWVAENIGYAIPGGGTARRTYDIRAGECGAHSFLLASFCRAVGIPARVVWGCMYVNNQGGSFGQHAWNEIYMGDAGWIPVDATVMEPRYVDSGHIRFGEYQSLTTSFNPHEMEVLDYRLSSGEAGADEDAVREKYAAYLGTYRGPQEGRDFEIFIQDATLTLDIPGQVALPFNEPDDDGVWHCKLTPRLSLEFEESGQGEIVAMILHERVTMPRASEPDMIPEDTPEDLRPYLGKYLFAQAGAEFSVLYHEGGLAVFNPMDGETVKLQPPDENGGWLDEYDKNTIFFEIDADGKVTALEIDAANRFGR
jgi:transglutaminase-like putative cysteine protease